VVVAVAEVAAVETCVRSSKVEPSSLLDCSLVSSPLSCWNSASSRFFSSLILSSRPTWWERLVRLGADAGMCSLKPSSLMKNGARRVLSVARARCARSYIAPSFRSRYSPSFGAGTSTLAFGFALPILGDE